MTEQLTFMKDPGTLTITATGPNGNIRDRSVQALLLFDIRHLLDEIRTGLVYVEQALEKDLDK